MLHEVCRAMLVLEKKGSNFPNRLSERNSLETSVNNKELTSQHVMIALNPKPYTLN